MSYDLAIIIPTLNEQTLIRHTIEHTQAQADRPDKLEIILVDAGSSDGTLEAIKDLTVKSYSKPEFALKKYESMNFGFEKASAPVIMFLDADTELPLHFDSLITSKLTNEKIVGGGFEFAFQNPDWKLLLLTWVNRLRYRFGKIFYGDQAVFVRKSILYAIGGVPTEPLMETAYLCRQVQKQGKLALLNSPIKTSPRRFKDHGFFTVTWFDINMFIRFNLGFSVASYAEQYWRKNLTK